ncbi:MAG: HD domain-containing protein [Candidatus Aenigmarchaeota archaeon]|nr:HD domain-containing protein [Candidatus Aenigmarchaeota archaeon]
MKFNIPVKENKKLKKIVAMIEKDRKIEQVLRCANITAVDRLGFSDHGPVHAKIVSNIALKLLRMLVKHGVKPSISVNYAEMDNHDAEIVVVLAAFLHDIGMIIHREHHDVYGIVVAQPILEKLLKNYKEDKKVIMMAEIFHAMTFHDSNIKPLTIEGGIVRIADGLDMAEDRARIPFKTGGNNIHAISAVAIQKIDIVEGTGSQKPIQIRISMTNSAGIYQVDELLKNKIKLSRLAEYVHVSAEIIGPEKKIVKKIEF